jgi:hypothetical protein
MRVPVLGLAEIAMLVVVAVVSVAVAIVVATGEHPPAASGAHTVPPSVAVTGSLP